MADNELLSYQVQEIVRGFVDDVAYGETREFDVRMPMAIDNGERIIGYEYLHGANMYVGGFHISGTII